MASRSGPTHTSTVTPLAELRREEHLRRMPCIHASEVEAILNHCEDLSSDWYCPDQRKVTRLAPKITSAPQEAMPLRLAPQKGLQEVTKQTSALNTCRCTDRTLS